MRQIKTAGYSLGELLITLLLCGIITSIAYPQYTQYLIRTHRLQAAATLQLIAARLELYHSVNNTYAHAKITDLIDADKHNANYYKFLINAQTPSSYTISAIPQNAQLQHDTYCGTLSLDEANRKTISGSAKKVIDCWIN